MSDELKEEWANMMSSPQYELFVNIIGIINILSIVVRQVDFTDSTNFIKAWIYTQFVINMIFMIELISDFLTYGFFKSYSSNFRMTPETLCQAINLYVMIRTFSTGESANYYNSDVKMLELVIFIRMLKLLTLLYEIKTLRIIIETMRNLIKPLANLCAVLLTIFYIFAQIGMLSFGGDVTKNNKVISEDYSIPDNYHLMNFNDFVSSLVTLYALMVVNNWMVITDMYVQIKDNNTWVRLYFCVFYYFSVIIGINIVVAFAIDMYSSVERLDEERRKTLEQLEKDLLCNLEQEGRDNRGSSAASED